MIFTHPGQLGDFVYTWPIAAWYRVMYNDPIHWVLPRCFGPFRAIEKLLMRQSFTKKVTLVDFPLTGFGLGGQPWDWDPNEWLYREQLKAEGKSGVALSESLAAALQNGSMPKLPYVNFGFRPNQPPGGFITDYLADMARMRWKTDWVLDLGPMTREALPPADPARPFEGPMEPAGVEALHTEHANFHKDAARIDCANHDVDWNVRWMRRSKTRHCWFSSIAVILYFARVPFTLYRENACAPTERYFPDRTRFTEVTLPHGVHPSYNEG